MKRHPGLPPEGSEGPYEVSSCNVIKFGQIMFGVTTSGYPGIAKGTLCRLQIIPWGAEPNERSLSIVPFGPNKSKKIYLGEVKDREPEITIKRAGAEFMVKESTTDPLFCFQPIDIEAENKKRAPIPAAFCEGAMVARKMPGSFAQEESFILSGPLYWSGPIKNNLDGRSPVMVDWEVLSNTKIRVTHMSGNQYDLEVVGTSQEGAGERAKLMYEEGKNMRGLSKRQWNVKKMITALFGQER